MELPEGGSEIEKYGIYTVYIKFENGRSNLILSGQFVNVISGPGIFQGALLIN